jgi:catechol 2,3-dioxygenase-like lactoylglutathione lyase family enzyme
MKLLREVWDDPLVRTELRGFINLSRNLLAARGPELEDRLREREVFLSAARIERTQAEILARIEKLDLALPLRRPRLGLVMLAARDPAAAVQFYRSLLQVEPITTSGHAGGYAEFELDGVHLAIHGKDAAAAGDPYLLGPPPSSLGWGAIFVFRVSDFSRYYANAMAAGLQLIDCDLSRKGARFFVVKDPSGYVIEITEEEPRGLKSED